MASSSIEIQSISEEWIPSLREAVGSVARERRYLMTVDAFSLDETRTFVKTLLGGGGVQFVALDGRRVVGWCDVVRNSHAGTRHAGVFGMGVVREFRHQGIGPALLRRTLDAARIEGIERVELEVFSSNERAIQLYERTGFLLEGRKRHARILDDIKTDILIMAKFLS